MSFHIVSLYTSKVITLFWPFMRLASHFPKIYRYCSIMRLRLIKTMLIWNITPCCCCYTATHLSFSPVVAVAVTVSTMTIQVPPTPPLGTLSVRWWNVTLMVIPQVSTFELYFSQGPQRFLFPIRLHCGEKMPPISPQMRAKYCSIVVLLWS